MPNPARAAKLLAGALAIAGLAGCASFLPKRTSPDEGPMPASFASESGVGELPERWWEAFGSPELNALVQGALSGNLTLRQAWARLRQAGATAAQVASSRYPDITVEAGASYDRRRTTQESDSGSLGAQVRDTVASALGGAMAEAVSAQLGGDGADTTGTSTPATTRSWDLGATGSSTARVKSETKQFSLGLAAGYEIDLWGRIWSSRQAADLEVQASYEDLQTTAMTLAAEVVTRWLGILEQRAQQALLQEQAETNRTYLDLVSLRFRKSLVSALDVYQQRQALAAVEKQISLVRAQERVLEHELAVLLGKPPGAPLELGAYNLDHVPVLPSAGIPADLLANRPDVRAAYARLASADYGVAVARADRLPAIRLTGRAAYSAGDWEFLFDDWFANLAANLTAPLLDGYRRKAEVERTRAVVEERLAAYRLTVLTAIREVEDALVREREQRAYIDALERQLDSARSALDQAGQRYRKGLNDYLPVLTALETTQRLTRDTITARRELLVYHVNLYRALGGSWTGQIEEPVGLSEQTKTAMAGD